MMNPLTPATMLSSILFLFFMAALFKAVTLKKQKDLFLYKLAEANGFFDEVREELKNLHQKYDKTKQFKNNLTAAELTTQLQKPAFLRKLYLPPTRSLKNTALFTLL